MGKSLKGVHVRYFLEFYPLCVLSHSSIHLPGCPDPRDTEPVLLEVDVLQMPVVLQKIATLVATDKTLADNTAGLVDNISEVSIPQMCLEL